MNERFSPINYDFASNIQAPIFSRSHSLRYTLWTLQWTGFYLFRGREVLYGFLDGRVSVRFHSTLQRIYTNFFPFHQSQFRSRQLTCWLVWKFIFIRSTEAIVLLSLPFPSGRIQRMRPIHFHFELERARCARATYLLSVIVGSGNNKMPSWNHSIFSSPVPVMEQLKMAVPPELTICTCGWMWTERYVFTCKRISTRCSPNWFDALHT